jgi:hypothetical protein
MEPPARAMKERPIVPHLVAVNPLAIAYVDLYWTV